MAIDWYAACNASLSRPLSTQLAVNTGCSVVAIVAFSLAAFIAALLWTRHSRLSSTSKEQVPPLSTFASRHLCLTRHFYPSCHCHSPAPLQLWKRYNVFCCMTCVGCAAGAVAWAANMKYLSALLTHYFLPRSDADRDMYASACCSCASAGRTVCHMTSPLRHLSAANLWNGVWSIAYPVEFMCLSASKLLVRVKHYCRSGKM